MQKGNITSRLDMILVSSGKAALCTMLCTKAEVDWNMIDSDYAGVKIWARCKENNQKMTWAGSGPDDGIETAE